MNEHLEKALDQWRKWDRDETTKAEIEALVTASNHAELTKLLCSRMAFGTAGLRSRMGAGFSQMNTLTIIQTVQGLLTYAKTQFTAADLAQRGICVGFDARYDSDKYGALTAMIFARGGVRVRLFSDIVPTPYVAFNVREYDCCAGVMCTASHNPKEDNGYKVYWADGAQIIPPHDKGIAEAIDANLEPWPESWDLPADIYAHPLIEDPTKATDADYNEKLAAYCMNKEQNAATNLRFTYTPVHGVGTRAVKAAMAVFSLPELIEVELQKNPDPEFPTVKFPNPEEGAGVLELAMAAAEHGNSRHILASDPDADRLAVAEKTEKWRVFTGNELGALFGWWAVQCWKRQGGAKAASTYMLASTVSSKILDSIAKKEGIKFEDTLTGFKWMGSRSKTLIDQGNNVIFAFEEAIGFMFGSNVLDKDGVSAAAVMAEFIVELNSRGMTLGDQLEAIYAEYGFHMTNNSYFICHEKPTIIKMFNRLRKWNAGAINSYPPALGDFTIAHVRDLTTGYDSREADFNATLPSSASSQMITFYFDNGAVLTMRTSGTEPKIKYYTEMIGSSREDCNEKLNTLVALMASEFFEPEKNGLISRST